MTMKNEIKACLIADMEENLDPFMIAAGFKRAKSSLIYKRRLNGSTQAIDLVIQVHPKDRPDSSAAIYPQMEVLIPAVDCVLDEIVGNNLGLLEGVSGGKTKQPIGFTSEKIHAGRWFVFQPDSIKSVVEDIKNFMDRWALPFLDVYATPGDILAADERGDGRISHDRAQLMRVVAAALVLNRQDYARAVMDKWFNSPGLRRRYQQVFDYITSSGQTAV